jgi:tetratricopeptide (TPR) repeat protein
MLARWILASVLAALSPSVAVPPSALQSNSGAGARPDQAVTTLTHQAQDDFRSGRYSLARDKLRRALKLEPRNPALWMYLGLTDTQLNEVDSAIADFEQALSLEHGDAQTRFNLGLLYRRKGDAPKAIEMYQQGLALEPDDAAANQNYALLLMEAGRFHDALAPLEKLRARSDSDLPVRVALIECYLKAGMQDDGEQELKGFLGAPNATSEQALKLAKVLVEDGQPAAAQEVLEHVIKVSPDSPEAHATLGLLLLNRGQYEDATEQLGLAVQLAPESAEYSMRLAEALILWKHCKVALQFLAAVKDRFGNLPEYRYKLGLAYYGLYQYNRAITEFEAIAAEQPNLDLVQFFLGNSYAALGDVKKAQPYYRKAIALNSSKADYFSALAQALRKESDNNIPEAIDDLEHALHLDPSDLAAKQELALCYEKKAEYARAQSLLEEVVKRQPDLLSAHVALARIYYREKKKEEGDKEKMTISRLEARQQAQQSEGSHTPAAPNP